MNFASKATVANFKKDEKEVNQTERRAGMQKFTNRRNARAKRTKLGFSLLKHNRCRRRLGFLKGLCHGIFLLSRMLNYVVTSMKTQK